MPVHCQFCSYRCTSYRSYVKHVLKSHSSTPNFLFSCGINGCSRTYNSIKSHCLGHNDGELESNVDYLPTSDLNEEATAADPGALKDLVQPEPSEIAVFSNPYM